MSSRNAPCPPGMYRPLTLAGVPSRRCVHTESSRARLGLKKRTYGPRGPKGPNGKPPCAPGKIRKVGTDGKSRCVYTESYKKAHKHVRKALTESAKIKRREAARKRYSQLSSNKKKERYAKATKARRNRPCPPGKIRRIGKDGKSRCVYTESYKKAHRRTYARKPLSESAKARRAAERATAPCMPGKVRKLSPSGRYRCVWADSGVRKAYRVHKYATRTESAKRRNAVRQSKAYVKRANKKYAEKMAGIPSTTDVVMMPTTELLRRAAATPLPSTTDLVQALAPSPRRPRRSDRLASRRR